VGIIGKPGSHLYSAQEKGDTQRAFAGGFHDSSTLSWWVSTKCGCCSTLHLRLYNGGLAPRTVNPPGGAGQAEANSRGEAPAAELNEGERKLEIMKGETEG